jgi:hypothetical protein
MSDEAEAEAEVKVVEPTTLATFPRRPWRPWGEGKREEIRISISEHDGEFLTSLRIFYEPYKTDVDEDGDGWRPTRAGVTLHANELREAHSALGEAIRIVEAAGQSTKPGRQRRSRKRRPPTTSEVIRLRRYAESPPFEDADLSNYFRERDLYVINCIKEYDEARREGKTTRFSPKIMEQGKVPKPLDRYDPWRDSAGPE